MRFKQIESVLQTKNRSEPAKNWFSVALRPTQGKPFSIAIDRDLCLAEFSRKNKQKREKHLKRWLHCLFDSEYIKTSVFAHCLKSVDKLTLTIFFSPANFHSVLQKNSVCLTNVRQHFRRFPVHCIYILLSIGSCSGADHIQRSDLNSSRDAADTTRRKSVPISNCSWKEGVGMCSICNSFLEEFGWSSGVAVTDL